MKGQFFILTAVFIVFILYSLFLYLQQFSSMDVATYLYSDEIILMRNLFEKIHELNKSIETCAEFRYFSKDFLETVKNSYKNKLIKLDYSITMINPCNNIFSIDVFSPKINLSLNFQINRTK
ncbi:MAG: hypothetical protein QXO40_05260 [Candidatus Aenigmatarchaeota archaeon]